MESPKSPARTLYNIALQHFQSGQYADAERVAQEALVLQRTSYAGILQLTGVIAVQQEKYEQAVAAFRQAVELDPNSAEAHNNLGNALKENRQPEEAISVFQKAISLRPHFPEAYNNLGNALKVSDRLVEAIAAYRKAIFQDPLPAKYHHALANAFRSNGQPAEAIGAYQRAIGLDVHFAESYGRLRAVMVENGLLDEALVVGKRSMEVFPERSDLHSDVIFSLLLYPHWLANDTAKEFGRWNQQFAEPLRPVAAKSPNICDPDRRLRVGYVSPDLRVHVVGQNIMPLFANHDHSAFEIFAYANIRKSDFRTDQIRSHVDQWRVVWTSSNAQLAEQIRADQIDILVDLALHTSENRLLTFARKPAPLQITFGGYPGTTGLHTIDYRISDPYLDPPDADTTVYSEQTLRLPHSFWCYDPLENRDVAVGPLPSEASDVFTFGCLNQLNKINNDVLALWAQVLKRVEKSRLLLLAPTSTPSPFTVDRFSRHGIDPARVTFAPRRLTRDYLHLYHQIDLGLDSFPYNGHTTSLDSLWMGVPVITLVGQAVVSRAGWCQLSNLGLTELAAHTAEQFVQIATDLAHDRPRLRALRSTLRQRMEASPLMNGPQWTRDIEQIYRHCWRNYCQSAAPS